MLIDILDARVRVGEEARARIASLLDVSQPVAIMPSLPGDVVEAALSLPGTIFAFATPFGGVTYEADVVRSIERDLRGWGWR